ncbi:hypothetical protein [Prevotella corporis]|uniref:hypothetical protein n=1 Tax=Prevotella corporis TaxID=28128 RepID=UPI0023EFFD3A|nr:hypothetical protein [Prevotella corporis]
MKRIYQIPCVKETRIIEKEMILAGSGGGPGGDDITPPDTGSEESGTTSAKPDKIGADLGLWDS